LELSSRQSGQIPETIGPEGVKAAHDTLPAFLCSRQPRLSAMTSILFSPVAAAIPGPATSPRRPRCPAKNPSDGRQETFFDGQILAEVKVGTDGCPMPPAMKKPRRAAVKAARHAMAA